MSCEAGLARLRRLSDRLWTDFAHRLILGLLHRLVVLLYIGNYSIIVRVRGVPVQLVMSVALRERIAGELIH